ncbi:MAG: 30S ribosomal protein S17 [Deltaproteobacteria bacterium]|nr:30S ribosomal protein S17 [Deltaproteobacteria bacterium]
MADKRGKKKTLQAVVVSNKMDKTVVVMTERLVKHPRFHKYLKKHARYKAHDELNTCGVGDKVLIVESRPLSGEKRWRVREILEKAK